MRGGLRFLHQRGEDILTLFTRLRARAESAANRPDAKVKALVQWLETNIRPNGEWSNERVIIFTEYKTTQSYLHQHLASKGFTADGRLELIRHPDGTASLRFQGIGNDIIDHDPNTCSNSMSDGIRSLAIYGKD